MKKQTITKIISSLLVLVFVISFFDLPKTSQAANANLSNYYSNPNQDAGKNPYKFRVSDVVNSNILTSVVGCTGVVNKVSTWMSTMLQSPFAVADLAKAKIAEYKKAAKQACLTLKSASQIAGGSIPLVGGIEKGLSTAIEAADIVGGVSSIGVKSIKAPAVDTKTLAVPGSANPSKEESACADNVNAMSDDMVNQQIKANAQTQANAFKEQCFDGIAITLARNQLTAMTRSAMNWVNSGYGGNPFFVQNMRNFTAGIERNVLETGIDVLLAPNGQQNPYATDFAKNTITNRNLISSSSNFLGGLQSSLQNFVTDPQSYYTDKQLDKAGNTITTLQRSQEANNAFSRSFSSGGWAGWLAFTQMPQNNPLGFNVVANQYLADVEMQQVQERKDELTQNNGFLSQKSCIKWQIYDKNDKPKMSGSSSAIASKLSGPVLNADGTLKSIGEGTSTLQLSNKYVYSTTEPISKKITEDGHGKCVDWKITTPGSIIKEKTSNYLNSPERQLELAKTINDSLNALFSVLISKLQGGGLSGLSDSVVATNWTDNVNRVDSTDGTSTYNNGGSYDGFNLTRDLGNTYIHDDLTPLGTWNAKTNTTNNGAKLYPDLSPEVREGDSADNSYYTVSVAGNTKLINEGYNGWAVGDRAFWDGSKWQNWQKGQTSPIKNRGVIQIQQDYIVAAKELLKILPSVMPALGELDYCLPGPNPSYATNSMNSQSAYSGWIGSAYVGPVDSSGERFGVKIDNAGDSSFETLHKVYQNNNVWNSVMSEKVGSITDGDQTVDLNIPNVISVFSNICDNKESDSLYGDIYGGHGSSSGIGAAVAGGSVGGAVGAAIGAFLGGHHSYAYRCSGNYTYAKNGNLGTTQNNNLQFKTRIKDFLNNYINSYLFDKFYEIFDQKMNNMYFKKMTDRYVEYENKPVSELNPAYVPMAESGFEFTKNIVSYGENTINAQKDYASAITQAKVNIAKLEPIKNDVNNIIIAAQKRRDANLIKILNDEAVRTGGAVLTEAAYKKKYAGCLNEENINVFDTEDIVGLNEQRNAENCTDGIDNDLDGLIDSKDPDCGATTTITRPNTRRNVSSDEESAQ